MKKILLLFIIYILLFSGCSDNSPEIDGTQINLSDDKITVDGLDITSDTRNPVYAANDIVFYLAGQDFKYGEGTKDDEHEQSEADAHTVVHITKPGKYILSGKLSLGQIAVDLGKEATEDQNAVVTLVLNNIDITCNVAPAIIFYNVYECNDTSEDTATKDIDTSKAGANVIIADGSENNINGSYVAKIYKSIELNDDGTEVIDSKKLHKYDGAFYSTKSININGGNKGNGILNIKAENEGLDSELHLTINGGVINIDSGNDGINTNEDNVSVTTINGGTLNILCNGKTGEGDGIDSNGWLVINGGTVLSQACATSVDAGIDSDKGIYLNGGRVVASGNMLDNIAGRDQTYAVFNFVNCQNGNNTYTLKDSNNNIVGEYSPVNAFTYLIVAGNELIEGDYTFWQGDMQLSTSTVINIQGGMHQDKRPEMPNNNKNEQNFPPEIPDSIQTPDLPNGERPPMPNDKNFQVQIPTIPNGEIPALPNGQFPEIPKGVAPPNNKDENATQNDIPSTIFTIIKGRNQFANIAPATQ